LFGGAKPKFVASLGSRGPDTAPSDFARIAIAEVAEWLGSVLVEYWISIRTIRLGSRFLT
jgi:hypothetical protein